MRVLLSWLRDFAPVDGDPEELADHLSGLGLAVEEMVQLDRGLDGVVVAEVKNLRAHPNADRIQLVDVDAGDGELRQVCCGAFNLAVGDRVPLATVGSTLPNGVEIGRRKLRGEWSEGMLCSPVELGLGDDAGGILILPPDSAVGNELAAALGVEGDVLYDLEVNPNRPDAMSVTGVARDLAARLRVPFSLPAPVVPGGGGTVGELATVEIVDPDRCGRFVARVLQGVEVGPSPSWLAARIRALGMRPINNIVDVSNYVMLELGHPNHTYDLARVEGRALRVRAAREGEVLVTLDGEERGLTPEDALIADGADQPVGLAGIMGGASTEISDTTTDVLLEAAWWFPLQISRTSRRTGLRTEASIRFERGADPWGIDLAVDRFCELLGETGARTAEGTIDERGDLPESASIRVRTPRVNRILGTDLSSGDVQGYLTPIGFEVQPDGEDAQVVGVPSFRPDVSLEIDVIEEVARHHAYENIPTTRPSGARTGGLTEQQRERRLIRRTLVGLGLSEALPVPFLAPGDLERSGLGADGIRVTNPLVAEESILRTSLRPGLLKAIRFNETHRNADVRLFEIGHVFLPTADGLPDEPQHLGVAIAGVDATEAVAVWEALVEVLALADTSLDQRSLPGLHATRAAVVLASGEPVGEVGEVDPGVLAAFEIEERVAWLELNLDRLHAAPRRDRQYQPVSRYPSSDVDLAFVIPDSLPAAAVESTLRDAAGDLLADLQLFDVYRGEQLGDERRSVAYRLRFQANDRTLTDDEVAEVRARCIDAVTSAHGAELRG